MEIIRDIGFALHDTLYRSVAGSAAAKHESMSAAIRRLLIQALAGEGIIVPPYPGVPRHKSREYMPESWHQAIALLPTTEGMTANRWWSVTKMPHSSFFRLLRRAVALGKAEKRSDGLYYRVTPAPQNDNEVPVRDPSTT